MSRRERPTHRQKAQAAPPARPGAARRRASRAVRAFSPLGLAPRALVPWLALGGVAALLAWCYAHLFAGEPHGLDNTAHLAEVTFLSRAIKAGDWNAWDPAANSGFASGYYYQVLPQALTAALAALTGLAPLRCFQIALFLPLVLAPFAAYRALRVLGAGSWAAVGAAIALPFTLAGNLAAGPGIDASRWGQGADGALSGGLFTQLWAFAALPLALAYAARWLESGRGLAAALALSLFVGLCHPFAGVALGLALVAGASWRAIERLLQRPTTTVPDASNPDVGPLIGRLALLAVLLLAGSACAWLPVLVDYAGFGGFPARVADEVGPGFVRFARWIVTGRLLDFGRWPALTLLLPLVIVFARARWLAWLWAPAIAYALLLGIGPHLGKTPDDLFPAVRFLGPLQIVLALAIGAGAMNVARPPADAGPIAWRAAGRWRLAFAATLMIVLAVVVVGGARAQRQRVKVMADFAILDRTEFLRSLEALRTMPGEGRLQVALGAECHWTLQLPYVYEERPTVMVAGGAALQSSPVFAYAWAARNADPARVAWVFDAPLLLMRLNHSGFITSGEPVWQGHTYQIRRFSTPGLVGPVDVVGTLPAERRARRAAALEWLDSELPMSDQVLADSTPAGVLAAPPAGRLLLAGRGPSRIRARVHVDETTREPTTFAIRESWHPRWRATLDGAPVALRRITPDYMAVDVPGGDHLLDLTFRRPAWYWWLWLLVPALVFGARLADVRHARPLASARR
jgi:hypothetical protein